MFNCNCTLAGTNACEHCDSSMKVFDLVPGLWHISVDWNTYKPFEMYNPETHELVEKKYAKIKRLKDENELKLSEIENLEQTIERLSARIKEKQDVISKNNEELKELE